MVRVAVYRTASDAIHNVVKHAGAATCAVEIQVEPGQLTLSVTGDGHYLPEGRTTGVGLHSMQERAVELGGTFSIQPAIAQRMMSFFSACPALPPDIFPELTDSERNVLRLMAQRINNEAIAQELSLSGKTVRNYVSNIFSKLQVIDRAQAIVKARDAG